MIRKPVVAGQFYEDDFQELDKQIKECFLDKRGPGDFPISRGKKVFGIISPHAGYQFSGPCMAWAYKEIAEAQFPKNYIMIGPSHMSYLNKVALSKDKEWQTPFGVVKVDKDHKLLESEYFKEDFFAFDQEHSVEVQLPFLQFASKDNLDKLKIIPVLISGYENYKEIAEKLSMKNSILIASSDFTHYGSNYRYKPFIYHKKESMYELDGGAIEFIKKLDVEGFLNYVKTNKMTICGASAIAIVMEACKNLGATRGRLLQYYTSGDVLEDYENMVGYGAIVFE